MQQSRPQCRPCSYLTGRCLGLRLAETGARAQYRMGRDIQDLSFLGPRIMDKLVLALIIMSLYWRVGANTAPSNVNNITAVLFLWTILPGYAAASYMPSIVLERPLFVRCAPASVET